MRALKTGGLCLIITAALAVAATVARASELLVMPYRCSVIGGEVVLRPSGDEGHRIVSRREQRNFTACSPADSSQCRRWQIHRFDIDCGGDRVPWTEVVAAADHERNAWVENGTLKIRMPSWWAMSPDDPCAWRPEDGRAFGGRGPFCARKRAQLPPAIVSMPNGFAPKFGLDAIFVDDDRGPALAGREPQVGGYEARHAERDLPPVLAEGPRSAARRSGTSSDNIPFKVAPPAEGLSVEPSSVAERAPVVAEKSEPQITWAEPPPLPPRLDPSERRAIAQSTSRQEPERIDLTEAPPVLVAPPAPAKPSGTSTAPTIINRQGSAAEHAATKATELASNKSQTPAPQTVTPATGQTSDVPASAESDGAPLSTQDVTAAATPQASTGAPLEPVETSPAAAPAGLLARVLQGEPSALAVVVISGGLLAILLIGLTMSRRSGASRSDEAPHDLASVSFEKDSAPEPSLGKLEPTLGATPGASRAPATPLRPSTQGLSASAPAHSEPTLAETPAFSAPLAEQHLPRRPVPAPPRRAIPQRNVPAAAPAWGNAIPQSHADALRVLGMGVRGDSSPASIKKIVDGLRMSWHPDHAENETDREERELRLKQINAAWEIISGRRPAAPDAQELRRPETLHL